MIMWLSVEEIIIHNVVGWGETGSEQSTEDFTIQNWDFPEKKELCLNTNIEILPKFPGC